MEDTIQSASPVPTKQVENVVTLYNFFDALKLINEGKTISKKEWNDSKTFFSYMKDNLVMINNESGEHTWIISKADIEGEDYFII